jgi:hypothetical protein
VDNLKLGHGVEIAPYAIQEKGSVMLRGGVAIASVVLSLAATMAPVQAKELPPGTVISAANLNQVLNDTFEGHTIDSMLTDSFKRLIRD